MVVPPRGSQWPDIGEVVEAYESALARGEGAEVADYAPPEVHPGRMAILCELVRVDLEHRWERGSPLPLEDYRARFPDLFEERSMVRAMAFEEFRLRLQAGEAPTPDEYRGRFGLEVDDWAPSTGTPEPYRASPEQAELLRSLDRTDPHAAERLAQALAGFPTVGSDFLGFTLRGELGRGAFGRVYLARQGDLADRLIALKVSADVAGESHALARLQHTNIVPIYSVHRRGPLQAVCMPFLGASTLSDTLDFLKTQAAMPKSGEGLLSSMRSRKSGGSMLVPVTGESRSEATVSEVTPMPQVERLRGLGYVPAVLWVMARVADGLAHAHDRGILHRDLKPANILFADDGEPVLLDFNLAIDTAPRAGAVVALVGGTLPYMAPEQLAAFLKNEPSADPRSDVYALGVILYELLTGAHPFPIRAGEVDAVLPSMIADRLNPAPDVRRSNASASPAVASIVRHCLEPDPARRYASAREFQEDLARQLDDRPLLHAPEPSSRERLAKWSRRHPRLTSSTTVGLVAAALLGAVGAGLLVRHRQYQAVVAAESYRQLGDDRRQVAALLGTPEADRGLVEPGLALCREAAGRYGVFDSPGWLDRPMASALPSADRDRLRGEMGDLLLLWARALIDRAAGREGPARSVDLDEAGAKLDRAEPSYGPGAVPRALRLARADLARVAGKPEAEVGRLVLEAEAIPLRDGRERLLVDPARVDSGLRRQILDDAEALAGRDSKDFAVWVALGNWNARLGRPAEALTAYNVAVALAPGQDWVRYNRGFHLLEMKDDSRAIEDFDRVLEKRPDFAHAYLNRALARLGLGDARGAADDLTRCLARKDAPSQAWFLRSRARQRLGDLEGARLDRDRGLKEPPGDPAGFVARGLARLPADVPGAIADFDAALAIDPKYRHALQDKASVLSETLGRPEEAVRLLDVAVDAHPDFIEALAGRAVLLARLGRREEALRDAKAMVVLDARGLIVYQAACVYALTSKTEPADRPEALRYLAESIRREGSWLGVARRDTDLDPIRDQPAFAALLTAFEVVLRDGAAR